MKSSGRVGETAERSCGGETEAGANEIQKGERKWSNCEHPSYSRLSTMKLSWKGPYSENELTEKA